MGMLKLPKQFVAKLKTENEDEYIVVTSKRKLHSKHTSKWLISISFTSDDRLLIHRSGTTIYGTRIKPAGCILRLDDPTVFDNFNDKVNELLAAWVEWRPDE